MEIKMRQKKRGDIHGNEIGIKSFHCFQAQKCRIEAVEMSLRERRHLPSPIVARETKTPANSKQVHQHRRVSIFNPLTRESRPSVIQLSLSKPMPPRARQLVFSHPNVTSSTPSHQKPVVLLHKKCYLHISDNHQLHQHHCHLNHDYDFHHGYHHYYYQDHHRYHYHNHNHHD